VRSEAEAAATARSGRTPAVEKAAIGNRKASAGADYLDTLQLLPTDTDISIRVFVDRKLIEAYWMDGRVAMTHSHHRPTAGTPQAEVYSTTDGVQMVSAKAYAMESIWVSTDEVLATPRMDGGI
jgi:hypothetical protein